MINKRKKSSRKLGSNTYGWGKNQHRGAGTRGGRGNAGSGKKAHCKETKFWKVQHLGKNGFTRKAQIEKEVSINLKEVVDKLPTWIKEKRASEEKGTIKIDLKACGYTKLLATGKATKKFTIIIPKATAAVEEKIKAAGGEIIRQ